MVLRCKGFGWLARFIFPISRPWSHAPTKNDRHECHYLRYFLSTPRRRYSGLPGRNAWRSINGCTNASPAMHLAKLMSSFSLEKALHAKQQGWKRRHERYRTDFPLKATVLREEGYAELQGRCGDIGRGGIGAVFTAECGKGEVISLEFLLPPGTEPLCLRSIVRYRRGFLHGLEFLGLTEEQRQAIDSYCSTLTPSG
jgi:hypothetical protein